MFPNVERSNLPHDAWVLTTAHAISELPENHTEGQPYPYTCGSGFFICLQPAPFLDGNHCVFGKVVSGFHVLEAIENVGSRSGTTSKVVKIADCGERS